MTNEKFLRLPFNSPFATNLYSQSSEQSVEAPSFVNGLAKISINHKWGFIDASGNLAIKANL